MGTDVGVTCDCVQSTGQGPASECAGKVASGGRGGGGGGGGGPKGETGLFWKVEKALVGMELCLVDVSGEACMCKSKLWETAVVGVGNRDSMGVNPE